MDSTNTMPASPRPVGAGKWLIVALLGAVAACLAMEVARSAPAALAQPAGGSSADGSIIAVSAQLTADSYGVYLLDTRRGTMAVYQYQPTKRTLRLMAARNYGFDTRLEEYNTEPSPNEIRQLVQQQKRLVDANGMK